MTVCIRALSRPDNVIVTASDMMLSDEITSHEAGAMKLTLSDVPSYAEEARPPAVMPPLPPWTSNYLLLAWAASLPQSGGPRFPRALRSPPTGRRLLLGS